MSSPTSLTAALGQVAADLLQRQLQFDATGTDMDFQNGSFNNNTSSTTPMQDADNNNNNNTTSWGTSDGSRNIDNESNDRDAYEFVAFLLWYLFLVLCCVIPTCCAYRRRRMVEARIAQQQASVNRIERQNVFILRSLRHNEHNTERIREQRHAKILEKLKETTMTVDEKDIVDISGEEQKELACAQCSVKVVEKTGADGGTDEPETIAVEYDVEAANPESTHALQLVAAAGKNDSRRVPAACAICLCPYEKDDEVTWSTNVECQHAFHKECIIPWLAKSDEAKCPCCRQDFCEAIPMSQLESDSNNMNMFSPGFSNFLGGDHDGEIFWGSTPFHVISPYGTQQIREQTSATEIELGRHGSPFVIHDNNTEEEEATEDANNANGTTVSEEDEVIVESLSEAVSEQDTGDRNRSTTEEEREMSA